MLLLNKLTGWSLTELRSLTWDELTDWLNDAIHLHKEINAVHG